MEMLHNIFNKIYAFVLKGDRFHCPLCSNGFRKFLPAGVEQRPNGLCPGCGSLERHRLLWIALNKQWDCGQFKQGGSMLHIAPEKALTNKFIDFFDYFSADLDGRKAMMAMDITAIGFPNDSFDAIVCNHVLEHVPQDRKALAELYRVLKPGGWGSIQVPMEGETTEEDPSVTDPAVRTRLYGQSDHIRRYGTDFVNRLKEAGFVVLALQKSELLGRYEQERISVACENEVILVRKPLLP